MNTKYMFFWFHRPHMLPQWSDIWQGGNVIFSLHRTYRKNIQKESSLSWNHCNVTKIKISSMSDLNIFLLNLHKFIFPGHNLKNWKLRTNSVKQRSFQNTIHVILLKRLVTTLDRNYTWIRSLSVPYIDKIS